MRDSLLKILVLSLTLLFCGSTSSQDIDVKRNRSEVLKLNSRNADKSGKADDFGVMVGTAAVLLLTPTLIYENKKLYFGIGRELCLAFGKKGEYRLSAEYTFIFRSSLKHHFRAALKYDILSDLNRGAWLDSRSYVSLGAGYFIDADGIGFSPEVSPGIRLGADEGFNLYLYAKLRHTFMTKKDKPDNTDLSIGMAIGFKPY